MRPMRMTNFAGIAVTLVAMLAVTSGTRGDTPPAPGYLAPWQLRPAAVANVVRVDGASATYHDSAGREGQTTASMAFASVRLRNDLAVFVREGFSSNNPPTGKAGMGLTNVAAGGVWARGFDDGWRLAAILGVALPTGSGGGAAPDATSASAIRAGILARSAMDNAMFAVNDVVAYPGLDAAYTIGPLTVQAEATVLELVRERGARSEPDPQRTNFTSGVAASAWLVSWLSATAELRYQRWLSTPIAVRNDPTLRDNASFCVGPRFHARLGKSLWLRPGIAVGEGIEGRMSTQRYRIVFVDVPIAF